MAKTTIEIEQAWDRVRRVKLWFVARRVAAVTGEHGTLTAEIVVDDLFLDISATDKQQGMVVAVLKGDLSAMLAPEEAPNA